MTAWRDARTDPPPLEGGDLGAWLESAYVLTWDGDRVRIGYYSQYGGDKFPAEWERDGVTHWAPLPEPPEVAPEAPFKVDSRLADGLPSLEDRRKDR